MRLILAEDEKLSRKRLDAALRQAGYQPIIATNGAEALASFERGTGPALLLLDWVMPVLDGVAVCRRVRAIATAPVYVIFMTSRGRQENMIEALEAGADDFVAKPFTIEALLARMRLGERVLSASGAGRFLFEEALIDGLRSASGVVVTRDRGTVGRVFLSQGRIAWAHVGGRPSGIRDVLGEIPTLTDEEIGAVLTECRTTGKHFADVLVARGIVDAAVARDRVRAFVSARIEEMARFRDARAMFVPEPWTASASLSFTLEEVFAIEPPVSMRPPSTGSPRSSGMAAREELPTIPGAAAVDGARSLCLLHGPTATVLARFGEAPEGNTLRSLLSVLQVAGPSRCEELSLTDDDSFHFVQRVPGRTDRFVYARVMRRSSLFAIARMQLGVVAASLAEARDDEVASTA